MRWLKVIANLLIAITIVVSGILAYLTITDSEFDPIESLSVVNNQVAEIPNYTELKITTFNIGYGGLGENHDLYSKGGRGSRASSKDEILKNLTEIVLGLDASDSEIFLLQEVDINASRSYSVDQPDFFGLSYPNFSQVYGINFDSKFVPVPIVRPVGKVTSGLMTMSRYNVSSASRHSLYYNDNWPSRLYNMDMCFVETRHPVENGRELVVINLQLSPFDEKRITRERQLKVINDFIEDEFSKGNYIIIGGDWNHNLPGIDPQNYLAEEAWPTWLKSLPEGSEPMGFKWSSDPSSPSMRSLSQPFRSGYSFMTVSDGFLISNNVEVVSTITMDGHFEHSHHNPVTMTFTLR